MLQKDHHTTLTIDGVDYGAWDHKSGGELDRDEQKYTPADTVQRTYVGDPTTGNITLERLYNPAVDGPLVAKKASLSGAPAQVVTLDRDKDGNFQGNDTPYVGFVKTITPPEVDSNSSDVAMISIEISCGKTTDS